MNQKVDSHLSSIELTGFDSSMSQSKTLLSMNICPLI